jgi:hypothetical protein
MVGESISQSDVAVTLPDAVFEARLDYHEGRKALFRGELRGFRDERGRWMVWRSSLEKFIQARQHRQESQSVALA